MLDSVTNEKRLKIDQPKKEKVGAVAVLGGGIAGMQAALDLADSGLKVYLVESQAGIGGVMAMLDKTFPTNDCAMCTMAPRLVEIGRHKDIELITMSQIKSLEGEPGNFTIKLHQKARYVDTEACTGCGACVSNCPVRNVVHIERDGEQIAISTEDQLKVKHIIDSYRNEEHKLLPVLEDVNEQFGYLPEEVIRYIAKELNYPLSLAYRLATFYNAFSLVPRGKNLIKVCMGTACYVKGGKRILAEVQKKLHVNVGEATPDLKFSLETVNCYGCCGQSPVMTVNDNVYGYIKTAQVHEILDEY